MPSNSAPNVRQFLAFVGIPPDQPDVLSAIRPKHVAAWRDHLTSQGLSNSSIRRKLTAIRSLFSYLQTYGYNGANSAHGDFVAAPAAARDGKTVALTPQDCRRLLDALLIMSLNCSSGAGRHEVLPVAIRDQAILGVLAYTGCRVGEMVEMKVGSFKQSGAVHLLEIYGKGGKERVVPLHPEAANRLLNWVDVAGIRNQPDSSLFRPVKTARGNGQDGFAARRLTRRAVQNLIERYVRLLTLDRNVTAHSLRVTALTTAREQGSDIIDLQEFAGHADPRTTLTYIRSRDRLTKSPALVLIY